MYYRKEFSNTTIFIAGCIHHLYIMPFDPVYRYVEVADSDERVNYRVAKSDGMWGDAADFGSLASLKGFGGPFRWNTVNFAGSQNHTGSRLRPPQYPTPSTLGEMVKIWSTSQIPDIAGDLCATSPQCGKYCNHEDITAFVIPVRTDLYQSFNAFSAFLLIATLCTIIYAVYSDAVHQVSLLATYQLELGSKDQTFAAIYLAQKKAQTDIEAFERSLTLDADDEEAKIVELDEFDEYIAPLESKFKSPRGRLRRQSSIRKNPRESLDSEEKVNSARYAVAAVVGANSGRMSYDTGKAQNLK